MEISSLRGSPEAALIAWFPDQGVLWLDGSSIILLRFIAVPKSYSGFGSCIFLARSFEVVAYGFCGWRGLFRPQDSCIPDAVYSIFKIHEIRFLSPFACIGEEVGNLIPFILYFLKVCADRTESSFSFCWYFSGWCHSMLRILVLFSPQKTASLSVDDLMLIINWDIHKAFPWKAYLSPLFQRCFQF